MNYFSFKNTFNYLENKVLFYLAKCETVSIFVAADVVYILLQLNTSTIRDIRFDHQEHSRFKKTALQTALNDVNSENRRTYVAVIRHLGKIYK